MANEQHAIDLALRTWLLEAGPGVPLPTTLDLQHDIEMELQRRADLYLYLGRSAEGKAWALSRSAESFWFWRDNFCWVFDEKRGTRIPYIGWDFHGDMQSSYLGLEDWHTSLGDLHFVAWPKSRAVGATVAACAAAVWGFAISKDHSGNQIVVSLQAKAVDDNTTTWSNSIFGKVRCMLDWLPAWMQPISWRTGRRFRDRHLLITCPERASSITGSSANIEGLRGTRGWRVWFDEANKIPRLDVALQAAQKIGPIYATSSVTSKHNGFGKLCHGVDIPLCEPGGDGVVVRRAHYSLHPMYDPTTEHGRKRIEAEKATMSKEAWAQEMEIDYAHASYGLIWGDYYDKDIHEVTAAGLRNAVVAAQDGRLYEGWDFGEFSLTSWVIASYVDATDTLYIRDYRSWAQGDAKQIANHVRDKLAGVVPYERIGDIAGRQSSRKTFGGRRVKPLHGWIHNLAEEGIHVHGQSLDVEAAIGLVRTKLTEGKIILMPQACRRHDREYPSVSECFQEYSRKLPEGVAPEDYVGDTPPPKKDVFSHTSDAVQHIAVAIWGT